MTVSAPARRELVSVVTEMLAASISLARRVCSTVGLALMEMISGVTPSLCRSFLSSITQIGLLVGLKPAHASLSLSCALAGALAIESATEREN